MPEDGDRLRAEEALRLLVDVTQAASEAKNVREMMAKCLQTICKLKGWPIGQAWRFAPGLGGLECVPDAFYAEWELPQFRAASLATHFPLGVGLPGRVWENKAPAWLVDVTTDSNFPRALFAVGAGLKAAFAFPIRAGEHVAIVFEFFSRKTLEPDGYFLDALEKLGQHLGIVLARLCADEERHELHVREQATRAEAEAANRRLAFLAEAGTLLAASLDYPSTLSSVARLVVPFVADFCIIDAVADGKLKRVELVHSDPAKQALLETIRPYVPGPANPITAAMVSKEAQFVCKVSPEILKDIALDDTHLGILKVLRPRSIITVPLVARARLLGVISVAMAESGRHHDERDLALVKEVARRAAQAIDNAQLYQAAQDAIREREEFLAMVSHDLRNPLNSVRLNSDLILQKLEPPVDTAGIRRAVLGIDRSTDRMTNLVRNLLEAARLENGHVVTHKAEHEVEALLEDALASSAALADEKSIRIATVSSAAGLSVYADREQILQVLSNLLGNAIKFTEPNGCIELAVAPNGPNLRFVVSDNGPGIPTAELPYLFERYWQAKRGDRRGIGLGLGIAKLLVEANGGTIGVESQVGRGSTFHFILQAALERSQAQDAIRELRESEPAARR